MAQALCFLCESEDYGVDYDLYKSVTIYSKTRLLDFLQEYTHNVNSHLMPETPPKNSILICHTCYSLLNELDNIQIRALSIQNQLKMYLESKTSHRNVQPRVKQEITFDLHSLKEEFVDLPDVSKTKNSENSNGERKFICEICGQAYVKQRALDIHIGMHNGINPFTCTYCNKSFTQKGALVRHTPLHTGQKPYQCDLCGKRFVHHTSFNMHRLTHTGEKTHKCETCGLFFMSRSHLKRHIKVHTGERRFRCDICGKQFAERYNLMAHEKVHLGGKTNRKGGSKIKNKIRCEICGDTHSSRAKLEEHLLSMHEDDII